MTKDVILFINAVRPATFEALESYRQQTGRTFTPVVLVDERIKNVIIRTNGQGAHDNQVITLTADFDSAESLRQVLAPYQSRLFAVTSQYENSILELQKLVPYMPYMNMPSERSLDWATEKKLMRRLHDAYDTALVPDYMEITDDSTATINHIEASLPYPVIVKPSGLEGSLLVSLVSDRQQLQQTLTRTFHEIQKGYDTWVKRQTPAVLVEAFMDGEMYSVDSYISADGTSSHTPPVKVITGRQVGFDDFFGYLRLAPSGLSADQISEAQLTAQKACQALGMRSLTAHVELMNTSQGWKIIELGPRIGGYRHDLYAHTYGINHIMNDILNRAGEAPVIPTKIIAYTGMLNIYAHQEGILTNIEGLDAVKALSSCVTLKQAITEGQAVTFAKNNGDPVLEILMSHRSEAQLQSDIKTLEKVVNIHVSTR
jgi:hypothetical protein